MTHRLPVLLLVFAVAAGTASASNGSQPVFGFLGLFDAEQQFSAAEMRVLENRLTGELVSLAEREGFSVTIPSNREELLAHIIETADRSADTLSRGVSAFAVIGGQLSRVTDRVHLDLRTVRVDDESVLTVFSADFSSVQDAIASVEAIIAEVVTADIPRLVDASTEDETIDQIRDPVTFEQIAGEWVGDAGIGTVNIAADGTAVATLNDTGTMRLKIELENGKIIARQDEPNSPKMYMSSFPYTVAVQIVDIARPMQWEFALSDDGTTLQGLKDTTFLQIDRGRVVWADNTYSREAVWLRSE